MTAAGVTSTYTAFAQHSLMTQLLPYIEHTDIYNAMDLTHSYRDTTAGNKVPGSPNADGHVLAIDGVTSIMGNVWAATQNIPTYVCPSNPFASPGMRDPAGFGGTDYFATVYTDISPTLGSRDKTTRMEGT